MQFSISLCLLALAHFTVAARLPKVDLFWVVAPALGLRQPRNQNDYEEIFKSLKNLDEQLDPPHTNTGAAHEKRLDLLLKIELFISDLANHPNTFGPGFGGRVHSLHASVAQWWLVCEPREVMDLWARVSTYVESLGYNLNDKSQSNSKIGFLRFFTAITWLGATENGWIPDMPEGQRSKVELLERAARCTIVTLLREWDDEEINGINDVRYSDARQGFRDKISRVMPDWPTYDKCRFIDSEMLLALAPAA